MFARFFELGLEKLLDGMFEINENLAYISCYLILLLLIAPQILMWIKKYKNDPKFRVRMNDDLKILAIGVVFMVLIIVGCFMYYYTH